MFVFCQEVQASIINIVDKAMCLQDPYLWTGSDVRIREPDMPNIHFAVAFKGASWSDPDSVALMVMQVSSPICCYHHASLNILISWHCLAAQHATDLTASSQICCKADGSPGLPIACDTSIHGQAHLVSPSPQALGMNVCHVFGCAADNAGSMGQECGSRGQHVQQAGAESGSEWSMQQLHGFQHQLP